jgi:hypothetical protein
VNSSWLATLDAFEAHLALQSRLVDEGRYDEVVAFEPPRDLVALPRVFIARATELLQRAEALEARVDDLRVETRERRVPRRRFPSLSHTPSAYVDQRA